MRKIAYDALQEKVQHGDTMLPFVQYVSMLPKDFTSFSMHWHKEVEIIYVESGRCQLLVDLESYELRRGDIVVINPSSLHAFQQYQEEDAGFLSWLFDMKMLAGGSTDACQIKYFAPFIEGKFAYPPVIRDDCPVYSQLRDILLQIHQICDLPGEAHELNLKWKLMRFFYLFFRDVCQRKQVAEDNGALQNIKIVIDYIQENFQQDISVKEVADLLHFSETYFMRFFKKYTGKTCIDYINEYRLERAAELLRSSDLSITEIAMQVGIHNISYFNRIFKKKIQLTPGQYRKESIQRLHKK